MQSKARLCLALLFTTGTVIAEAAFSFMGMMLLLRGTPIPSPRSFSLASGVFSLAIEGEVYWQNIKAAADNFWTDDLALKIMQDIMDRKNSADLLVNKFYQDRQAYRDALQQLRNSPSSNEEIQKKIHEYEDAIAYMEELAINYLQNKISTVTSSITEVFNATDKQEFEAIYQYKSRVMNISHVFNVLSSVGSFFCALHVTSQLFLFLGLSCSMGGLIGIAAVFAVGYGLMILRTIKQIVYEDLLSKWWSKYKSSFLDGNNYKKAQLTLGLLIFVGFGVAVSLMTAGTYWKTGFAGQMLLFNVSALIAKIAIMLPIIFCSVTNVIFNLKNIAESIEQIFTIGLHALCNSLRVTMHKNFIMPYYELFRNEHALYKTSRQLFMPVLLSLTVISYVLHSSINLLANCWNIVALLGHCLSEGVITDSAIAIPTKVAAGLGGVAELGADFHYLLVETDDPHAPSDEHHHDDVHGDAHHEHDHGHTDHQVAAHTHDHQHSNIPGKIFCITFLPLLLVDCALYAFLSGKSLGECFSVTVQPHWGTVHQQGGEVQLQNLPQINSMWKRSWSSDGVVSSVASLLQAC